MQNMRNIGSEKHRCCLNFIVYCQHQTIDISSRLNVLGIIDDNLMIWCKQIMRNIEGEKHRSCLNFIVYCQHQTIDISTRFNVLNILMIIQWFDAKK